jgi:hypothetical protein
MQTLRFNDIPISHHLEIDVAGVDYEKSLTLINDSVAELRESYKPF